MPRPSDKTIIAALRRAAKNTRRGAFGDEDHRLSETNFPARCAQCSGNWPCGAERKARNLDKLVKALVAGGR